MTAITGSRTAIIAKKSTGFATATSGSTGDKLEVEKLDATRNTEELRANPIGSGQDMDTDSQPGAISPTISVDLDAHYDDAGVFLRALFFGGESVTNLSSGAYDHSIMYEAVRNQEWATMAWLGALSSPVEAASCTPTKFKVVGDTPPDYVKHSIELKGNNILYTGTTNTATTIENATVSNTRRVVVKPADVFMINGMNGPALNSGTMAYAIKSFTIEYEHPAEHVQEIRNATGNSQVVSTGSPPFMTTLTVEFKNLTDFTWFSGQDAG
jgi:hypothetical protein